MTEQERLEEKCVEIMEKTNLSEVIWHSGWKRWVIDVNLPSIKLISLWPTKSEKGCWQIMIELHPADTMGQARNFYQNLDIQKFLDLMNRDWCLDTFFHLASSYRNVMWINTLELKEYLQFWKMNYKQLYEVRKEDFEKNFMLLKQYNMISDKDRETYEKEFIYSGKTVLRICPGVSLRYVWRREDVTWDNDFVKKVKNKIEEALSTWA